MSFWAGARVLVTAAGGFTGSHLCRQLIKEGARVRGLLKPTSSLDNLRDLQDPLELIPGDITDSSSLPAAMKGVEYVFHSAAVVPLAEAVEFPEKAVQVNSVGAYNVALAARKGGAKKMLQISTCHIYGNQPEYPIRETAVPRPNGIYAAAKLSGEILVNSLICRNFPIVFSRSFAKFGPGQSTQFLIPNIITQLLKGGEVRLGDPRPTRDYTYVVDVVRGYMKLLESGCSGETYHLSSGVERAVSEIAETIARICQIPLHSVWNPGFRSIDIIRQVGDSSKARTELGWQPQVSFEEGLQWTIEWWRERLYQKSLV